MWNLSVADEIATCYRDISSFYDVSSKLKNDLMILIAVGVVIDLGNSSTSCISRQIGHDKLKSDFL